MINYKRLTLTLLGVWFGFPLGAILCIAQARRWTARGGAPAGESLWQFSA